MLLVDFLPERQQILSASSKEIISCSWRVHVVDKSARNQVSLADKLNMNNYHYRFYGVVIIVTTTSSLRRGIDNGMRERGYLYIELTQRNLSRRMRMRHQLEKPCNTGAFVPTTVLPSGWA